MLFKILPDNFEPYATNVEYCSKIWSGSATGIFLKHILPKFTLIYLLSHFVGSINSCITVKMTPIERILMPTDCICSLLIAMKILILMTEFTFQLLLIIQHSMDWNRPQIMSTFMPLNDLLIEQNSTPGPQTRGCSIKMLNRGTLSF